MSLLDLNQIPGYIEAKEREQSARDVAFTDASIPLCGSLARQFTLTHLIILGQCENAFVTQKEVAVEDVALFLWVVSPEYRAGMPEQRNAFILSLTERLFRNRVTKIKPKQEIAEYLGGAFMDSPGSNGNLAVKSYTSFVASFVDLFAHEYGWSAEYTTSRPLAMLFQLVRRIKMRNRPNAIMFNPSDKILNDYLTAVNRGNN